MSIIINAPTDQVTVYDVAGQDAVQLNFDFDPTLFRTEGTTLVIKYEGHEIRLENFYNADGTSGVDNFLTQDGQVFSAADILAAVMGGEPGTGEDIETAAGNAGGGSGAGEYDDNAGNLYDGLDALGGQPDAYAHEPTEFLEGNESDYEGDTATYFSSEHRWPLFPGQTPGEAPWYARREYVARTAEGEDPVANALNVRQDSVVLDDQLRSFTPWVGTAGVADTLILPDDIVGVALLLEDNLSLAGGGPGLINFSTIQGGSGNDVIDLSSSTLTYGDVTVYGGAGDDVIWTNVGNDTISGGDGNDRIIGGIGDDVINGDAGNDIIKGSVGNDILNGGDGQDKLYGGEDADTISGGDGSDIIFGGDGADVIDGGNDMDLIYGQAGNDVIDAGGGDDVVHAGTGEHDIVTLGAGNDTLVLHADSLAAGGVANPLDAGGSTVEVLDFSNEDSFDLSGLSVLGAQSSNITGGAAADYQIHVGDGLGNEAWIVLTDTGYGDLSATTQAYLQSLGLVP